MCRCYFLTGLTGLIRSRSGEPGMGAEVRQLQVEIEQEDDGRWIAEVFALPGVMVYGKTRIEAIRNAKALALLSSAQTS